MTSVTRSLATLKEAITTFIKPESPSYNESGLDRLFPFTYSNGVLDISYEGNTFEATNVTTTGTDPITEPDTLVRIMSGPQLVTALGNNFKAYIRAWRDATIDTGSPINIYINPQVIRVQEADNTQFTTSTSYEVSTTAPSGDGYVSGTPANGYYATYIFKTPLTFTTVEGGVTTYITFRSMMDQD